MSNRIVSRDFALTLITTTYAEFFYLFKSYNELASSNNNQEAEMVRDVFKLINEAFETEGLTDFSEITIKIIKSMNNELLYSSNTEINNMLKRCYLIANEYELSILRILSNNIQVSENFDFISTLNINKPFDQNICRANLISVQQKTRDAEMYQRGGGGRWPNNTLLTELSTFCNQATFDIAEATDFNTHALYNGISRDRVSAIDAINNLKNAEKQGLVIKINGGVAQGLANQGYTIIAAGNGHLATVAPIVPRPLSNYYPDDHDPIVSNIGPINRIRSAYLAFNNFIPNFYVDPNQAFTRFNPSVVAQRQEPKIEKNNDLIENNEELGEQNE